MLVRLNVNEQNAIFIAYTRMDTYDSVTPGVEDGPKSVKVPFKLGSSRRIITKNMAKLRVSLLEFEESQRALFKETWPDKDPVKGVRRDDDPENFKRYAEEQKKMIEAKEEFDLLPLPAKVVYDSGNDFPIQSLETLEQHGLIEEEKT